MGEMAEYYRDSMMKASFDSGIDPYTGEMLPNHPKMQKTIKISNSMKTASVVKSVQASGTWNANDGTTYYRFDYEMEDGTLIQASHKTPENALSPGDPCEYEVKRTHPTYGKSGSVSKPKPAYSGGGHGGGDLTGIKVGHALNCASVLLSGSSDFWEANGENKRLAITEYARMIYEISEELNNEYKSAQQ